MSIPPPLTEHQAEIEVIELFKNSHRLNRTSNDDVLGMPRHKFNNDVAVLGVPRNGCIEWYVSYKGHVFDYKDIRGRLNDLESLAFNMAFPFLP